MSTLPVITSDSFKTKRGKSASHIMAFNNGQIVHCYGHEGNKDKLVDLCENYYLAHHCISEYAIHSNPFI